MIRVVCKQCSSKLDIREELVGTTRRCPKCKTEFTVPAPVDEEEDGVTIAEDSDAEIPVAQESKRNNALTATPVPAGKTDADAPVHAPAAPDDDDDDGEEDFMPSFMTTPVAEKSKSKTPTPKPSAPADDEDDSPVLSIPKTPPPAKPKFKSFEPDEFSEPTPPPRSKKKELPASLEERPRRNKPVEDDDEDDEPSPAPSRPKSSRPSFGARDSGFQLPTPGASGLSDPGLSDPGMPSTGGGARDRAQAARELRQALKESALKGPVEIEPQRSILVDLSILMSEIGWKGLAIIAGVIILLPALYFLMDGMLGGGPKLPKLGYVTGTVSFNGQPAANSTVFFQPVQEQDPAGENKKQPKVRTSFGQTDNQGKYKLLYMEGIEGVAVGKCRVWLELAPPMIVPGEFSTASVTLREVKSGSQTIDFTLTGPVKKK